MRKLKMKMSVSVDGFVGGTHGEKDWVFKSSTEDSRAWLVEFTWNASLIIMGSTSFSTMSPYWPTATGPLAAPMNEISKAVFTKKGYKVPGKVLAAASSSPAADSWANPQIFDGDLSKEIVNLKKESGKPILAFGGAGFMRSLIDTGLIDEYNLVIHPVVLGAGEPIFNGLSKPLDLKLVAAKVFDGGIVVHTYHLA
jgi:dihydrofolate reductase